MQKHTLKGTTGILEIWGPGMCCVCSFRGCWSFSSKHGSWKARLSQSDSLGLRLVQHTFGTLDGSEIPFPTTRTDGAKTLVNNGINYLSTGEFTGFQENQSLNLCQGTFFLWEEGSIPNGLTPTATCCPPKGLLHRKLCNISPGKSMVGR